MTAIVIVTGCASLVCNLFINFQIDITAISDQLTDPLAYALYEAQVSMGHVICGISGGCLAATTIVLLLAYIKHYIDIHKKELGILKALGYSRLKIAGNFMLFSFSVMIGTAIGYAGSFFLLPSVYDTMNKEGILPDIPIHFHPVTLLWLVLLPTLAFGLLAIGYAYHKLKQTALDLLREQQEKLKHHSKRERNAGIADMTFLELMRKGNIRNHPAMTFFIAFGAFCFADMLQMAASMGELSSELMSMIIFIIGLVLAFTSLILAVSTVVNANAKNISIMKVFGYSFRECISAVLNGYRAIAYLGFLIGTVYQYALIKLAVRLFADMYMQVPDIDFKWNVFFLTLIGFLVSYEVLMYLFSRRIRNIPAKLVMME